MRTTSRWLFWLALARLAVCLVWGEFFVLSGPDFKAGGDSTRGSQLAREMYCVTDRVTSSLVWNAELGPSSRNLSVVGKPYVLRVKDRNFVYPASDKLTCQMDRKSSCSSAWTRGNWSYASSLARPMSPVYDNRWEAFEVRKMSSHFEPAPFELPKLGSLSISIRGSADAHLALCNQRTVDGSCYAVVLGASNDLKSEVRRCRNGNCAPATLDEHLEPVLSASEWRTFVLKWNFQGKSELSVYDSNKKLLSASSKDSDFTLDQHQLHLFTRSSKPMLIKFHKYEYSMTTSTQSKMIGPEMMTSSSDRSICIEMSLSVCSQCMMFVDFVDSSNKNFTGKVFRKESKNPYDLPTWHNFRVQKTLPDKIQQPIRLTVNTLFSKNHTSDHPFWAISNVRRCYDGELKAVNITVRQENQNGYFWPRVTCQKISSDAGTLVIDSANRKFTNSILELRTLCPEGKIGESCSLSCSELFGNHGDCSSLQACDQSGCSCAAGYTKDSQCTSRCSNSTYGYECKQKCGNCTDGSCSFATGECKLGCESDKHSVYLPPFCKRGIRSLPPPNFEIINSTSVRLHVDIKTEYYLTPTSIQFEIWENSTSPFFVSNTLIIKTTTTMIEVFMERLKPGTRYRSIGTINARNKTLRGEWGNFTTPCTESVALSFPIHVEETSIKIDNIIDKHINDSCPHTWYNVQFTKSKKKLFNNVTDFPKTFTGLDPYSDYSILIKSHKSPIVNKVIRTLEGVPGPVKDLEHVRSSDSEITVRWQPPDFIRGVVINYTVEIKLIEHLGCVDFNASNSNQNLNEKPVVSVITNTSQGIFTHKFENLRPYSRYQVQVYASNSRHTGDKTELIHATSYVEIPTELFTNLRLTNESVGTSAASLRWDPPEDCVNITGPIRAAKLVIDSLGPKKTDKYFFPLEKSNFNGLETYEAKLYVLRGMGDMENKTNYKSLNFTMPARAPPPVRRIEIVEVDSINQTATLRWIVPKPPLHGILEHYSLEFCDVLLETCYSALNVTINDRESCGSWDSDEEFCKTVVLPPREFDVIQIRAFNEKVSVGSDPENSILSRKEFEPYAPVNISLTSASDSKSVIQVNWQHPQFTGGRLQKFDIDATVKESNLKTKPWTRKKFQFNLTNYEHWYNMDLELFPSTTFNISVRAVTNTGLQGESTQEEVIVPNLIGFRTKDLKLEVGKDLTISIKIPEVTNDVENSAIVLLVRGSRHCDQVQMYDESITFNSTAYVKQWKVITITDPSSSADKEFIIGDGKMYGNTKNYALCPEESYELHVLLINNATGEFYDNYTTQNSLIIDEVRTGEILMHSQYSVHYASWSIPLLLLLVLIVLLIFIIYKRRSPSEYLKGKNAINHQENVPLSNDYQDKTNSNGKEVEKFQLVNILNEEEKVKKFTMPIMAEEFEDYFESAYKSGQLKNEYAALKSGLTKPHDYGSQPEMKEKNRYFNLFPYDDSRVILEKLPDDPSSDYINASYVKGYDGKEKAYIAAQGPKPNTIVDFWRMVWQERVQLICMMSNLAENGKIKCERYWPSEVGKTLTYGKVSVEFANEDVLSDYTCRTFIVSSEVEQRSVEQLHYTSWPDHGVPSSPRSIVAFLKDIQRHAPAPRRSEPDAPPILVHCSAGVGRTGTLVVLDMALCRLASEKLVDLRSLVVSARESRLNLVNNVEQYLLLHLVLAEYLNFESSCFACSDPNVNQTIAEAKTKSDFYFQRVLDTSWWDEVLGSPQLPKKCLSSKNRAKHRFTNTAGSLHRLYLKRSIETDEDSDYIAATKVQGIFKEREFVTTQLPMPTTLADFWRMVSEQKVRLVLVLQQPDLQDPTFCELVPENQGFASTSYLKIIRQSDCTTISQYYFKEEVFIIDSTEPKKDQFVKIINYKNWPKNGDLPPPNEIVKLWKTLKNFDSVALGSPVVVVCRDGVSISGLWLTVSYLLDKMSLDNECDVPRAVRKIRKCRKDFLSRPEYFSYLYDVALAWSMARP